MANEEHLAILKQGVEVWNAWREKNGDIRPDLSEADLSETNLCEADLSGAALSRANLSRTVLSGVDLAREHTPITISRSWWAIGVVATVVILAAVIIAMSSLTGGDNEGDSSTIPSQPLKVGLSFAGLSTERWKNEEIVMRALLEEKDYEVISAEANYDVLTQNNQIENMVDQGVAAIIVIAEDGDTITAAVDYAADAGILIIAYDRLIKSSKIAAYITFQDIEVGRQQALGVLSALDIENGEWTVNNPVKLVMLNGNPTDCCVVLFRQGQDEIIDPYVEHGIIEIVADQWVDHWDPNNAYRIMENILVAQNNEIDAVMAMNDGIALGALEAMRVQGLAGIVPISGQGATAAGCNSIVKGELTFSILQDIRNLSPVTVELTDMLLNGKDAGLTEYTLAELTYDSRQKGTVMTYFLPAEQVNAETVYDLVVVSGWQDYDDVYRDIPNNEKPPIPNLGVVSKNSHNVQILPTFRDTVLKVKGQQRN